MDNSHVLGQESSLKYLKQSILKNRNSHALIFEGEDGMGKMTLAMFYAKSLLCSKEKWPCSQCSSCIKFDNGNHLDFKIIKPKIKKSISTEDISGLLSDAFLIPNDGDNKIYIIQKAHMMTPAAQNKLLKILEEPPEYLTIMMLCDNISNILSTILSRSVTIKMKKLSDSTIKAELIKRGAQEAQAKEIASFSNGNLGYALSILADKKVLEKYKDYNDIFFNIANNKIEAFSFLDKKRAEISYILVCWQKILSNCLKIKTSTGKSIYSEKEIIYAKKHQIDDIIDKLMYILQAESRLASNAQYLPTVDWLILNL